MAKLTPEQFAEKHNRRTKAALDDMRAGVENVTVAPTEKAAAKQEKMRQRLLEALESGKWANGLKRVSLEEWKQKMIELGLNRVASGLDANKKKVEEFAAQLLPHIEAGQKLIEKMPDVTLEDSINRMTAFIRHMSKFQRK
jgi:uncharacterized protein YeaC (DUF1315 family)